MCLLAGGGGGEGSDASVHVCWSLCVVHVSV